MVDASVLVEMVIDGHHRPRADDLLERWAGSPDTMLVTAAHGPVEAANALRGLARGSQLSADAGYKALGWLADLDLLLDPPAPRLQRMWELRDRMSAYDAAYAIAAESLASPLVTADRRLVKACAQHEIDALHLADYPRG